MGSGKQVQRVTLLQIEVSLLNVNIYNKRVISTQLFVVGPSNKTKKNHSIEDKRNGGQY